MFDIWLIKLNILHNYIDNSTKLFFNFQIIKPNFFLDISEKLFFLLDKIFY